MLPGVSNHKALAFPCYSCVSRLWSAPVCRYSFCDSLMESYSASSPVLPNLARCPIPPETALVVTNYFYAILFFKLSFLIVSPPFLTYLIFYLCLAALGLHRCAQAFSTCSERGLLIVVASLVAEHRLRGCGTWA